MSYLYEALVAALDDEYRARATYQSVIQAYGEVLPFINIVQAEQRHINALISLFEHYHFPLPMDRWNGQIMPPTSIHQACLDGIKAEISNYQMYDQLLNRVNEADVQQVFSWLRNASAFQHLPAFQYCAGVDNTVASNINENPAVNKSNWTPVIIGIALGAGLLSWLLTRRSSAESIQC